MKDYKLWIVLLALPAVGFTNCSYFGDVTVPAVDPYGPAVGSRVWTPDEPDVIHVGSVAYETQDPNGTWLFAPWGYDPGGIQVLDVTVYEDIRCCQNWNPQICAWVTSLTEARIDSENANPGDTVSNGRFDWFGFTPKTNLLSGTTCDLHRFGYLVQAADFAGNTSTATGSVTYTKPPMSSATPIFPEGTRADNDDCDRDLLGTPCSVRPAGCQDGFEVQGTWQCFKGNDTCIPPPEGIADGYCSVAWESTPNLCGKAYGLSCEAGDCFPGTICNLQYGTGTKCGQPLRDPNPPYEELCPIPHCWRVNEKANLCAEDWILPPRP
jgi:hypothetical protein